jgi:hypothetical protein
VDTEPGRARGELTTHRAARVAANESLKMKTMFTREFYIPKNGTEVKDETTGAVAYLIPPPAPGAKWSAKGFSGKRAKPDFYYVFKSEQAAVEHISAYFENVKRAAATRAERRAQYQAEKCLTVADVFNKVRNGNGYITAAETAICLRATLAKMFPGVKFSVTSENYSMGCAVRVHWTDGPGDKAVHAVTDNYSFAGFDGMIDMKYNKTRWLAPDGTMSLAHSEGTTASRGMHDEAIGSRHNGAAVLVTGGADYVTTSRAQSFDEALRVARDVARHYGVTMPAEFADNKELWSWINQTRCGGEMFSTMMNRLEAGQLAV